MTVSVNSGSFGCPLQLQCTFLRTTDFDAGVYCALSDLSTQGMLRGLRYIISTCPRIKCEKSGAYVPAGRINIVFRQNKVHSSPLYFLKTILPFPLFSLFKFSTMVSHCEEQTTLVVQCAPAAEVTDNTETAGTQPTMNVCKN